MIGQTSINPLLRLLLALLVSLIHSVVDFYGHNLNGPAVDSITAMVTASRSNTFLGYYERAGDISGLFNFPNIINPLSPLLAPTNIFLGARIHTSYY
jgi:hypothetical protein